MIPTTPDWVVGDRVAIESAGLPTRPGTVRRVSVTYVVVAADDGGGRLLKFSKKTGRKVAPYAQLSTWIRPWTTRDGSTELQMYLDLTLEDLQRLSVLAKHLSLADLLSVRSSLHKTMETVLSALGVGK